MPEKVKRVRRRRRISPVASLESLRTFRHGVSPERLAIIIAGIAVAIVVGIFLFSWGSKIYGGWSEQRLLKHASALLDKHDFSGAVQAAQKALQLHPDSLPAFYVLADATEKQNLIETVAWRAQIARLRPDDLDSQLNLASAALRFGELDTARKALEHVAPDDRDKATYHVVAGWLARAEGDEAGVLEHFAAAVKRDPKNELYQFNLAVLQIKSPDSDKRARARETLQRLSKNPQYRAGSLRALLNDAVEQNDLTSADAFAQDLQMSPEVTFADYLLCLNFYRKLDEKKFSILLEKVKPVAVRNPADLTLLIEWMNNNGLAADVLKWIDKLKPETTSSPPAAIQVAESFANVKNWSRLRRWTRNGSWGDFDYLRLAYQGFAARQVRQAGADAEFESLWRSAERAAESDPPRELILARVATKWNLPTEAEQLWLRVAKNPPSRREALDALVRMYRTNNDLPNLYRTVQRLHEIAPGDVDIAANYARLALMLDQNTADGHRVAKEAYDRAPKNINCAVTYAFSLYGLGRTAAGLDLIKKLSADQLHDPHAAAFVAVLLIDDNQVDAAKEYVDAARRGPIFVEEKKLLDEALAKLSAPATSSTPPPTGAASTPIISIRKEKPAPTSPPPALASPPPKQLPLPNPDQG